MVLHEFSHSQRIHEVFMNVFMNEFMNSVSSDFFIKYLFSNDVYLCTYSLFHTIAMTKRSPISVFFLSIFTIGIYILVWRVKTKREMNRLGSNIPTSWLMI